MSEKTQQGWEDHVHKVISEWFQPDAEIRMTSAPEAWTEICGKDGSLLESYLKARDINNVLSICYRLVLFVLSGQETSDAEELMHFLEECRERLRLPRLELKHIWYAEQWHDFLWKVDILKKQDIARAKICLSELESGEYYPGRLQWPWYTAR